MSGIKKIKKEIEELSFDLVEGASEKMVALEESLSVVEEVRNELAKVYVTHKSQAAQIDTLNSQLTELNKVNDVNTRTIEDLNKELDDYKSREAEVAEAAYNKRLENLSSAFKELGQGKTMEELSALPVEVIKEFESVTELALKNRIEETLSIATLPTQAMAIKPVAVKTVVRPVRSAENLSDSDLAKGICNALMSEQKKEGPDSRRIVRM